MTIYINANYDAIQVLEGAINSEIKNNIISISGNKSPIIMDSSSGSGAVINYNCYHGRAGTALTGPGKYSIADNPKFVDVANHDFHLQSNSPCINAGDPTNLVLPDGGSRIDIGAYKYTGEAAADTTTPLAIGDLFWPWFYSGFNKIKLGSWMR
jgi:hypothetical protein